jgi:hypothetical protein
MVLDEVELAALLIQSMNSVGVFCEMLCRSVSKSAMHTAIQQRRISHHCQLLD